MQQIKDKLVLSSVLRTLLLFSNIAVSFFIMPFLINALGDRWYGFWSVVMAFIGYYGFLDIGLSAAITRFVSRALGLGDIQEMNRTINTSFIVFIIIGVIAFLISCLAAVGCQYFIHNPDESAIFKAVILVLGLNFALGLPMRTFISVLQSKIRYDVIVYVNLVKLILRTLLIVYFIKKGHGVLALAFITLFVDLVTHIAIFRAAGKIFREMEISVKQFNVQNLKDQLRYCIPSFFSKIADLLRFQIDSMVIAAYLGLGFVTHYSIAARLIEYFVQLIISALGIMTPVFSQLEGKNDMAGIREVYCNVTRISVFISVFVGLSMIVYGNVFIQRWVGESYVDTYHILVILCVPTIIALSQNPSIGLLYGISKHRFFAISNFCEGVSNLALSLVLVRFYGMYGVALGTALPMTFFKLVVQPVYTCRAIGLSLGKYYVLMFLTALKCMIPTLLYWYLIKERLSPDYFNIVSLSFIHFLLMIPVFHFSLSGSQKKFVLSKLHLFIKTEKMVN